MVSREIIGRKLSPAVEADVLVAPEQESILQRWIESVAMDLAVTSYDAGQSQDRLLALTINASTHLKDSAAEGPDDEALDQHRCSLFLGKPTYRNTRFV